MSKNKDDSQPRRPRLAKKATRCVIVNPKAGAAKDLDALLKQLERLKPGKIFLSRKFGDAEARARSAVEHGFDEILAAGGDGTLNEVINGVAQHFGKVRIGLIPLGTGNDFARCLDLPAGVEENIDVVLAGKSITVDVVKARSRRVRHFINVSTGGFSGCVDEKITPQIKRTWGSLAYLRAAAAALPKLQGYQTSVVLNDDEELSLCLYNVVVANGRYVAGGMPIAPEADFADGMLDVVLIPKRPTSEMVLLAAEIILGKHLSSNMVIAKRAKKVAVKSRPGMWFNVDGELVGNSPVTFSILPRALRFLVAKE